MMPAATGPTTHTIGGAAKWSMVHFAEPKWEDFKRSSLFGLAKLKGVPFLLLVSTFLTKTCSVNVSIQADEVTLNLTKLEISSAGGDHA